MTARFGNKESLVEALIERTIDRWSDRAVALRTRGKSGLESVGIFVDAIRAQVAKEPRGVRVLYALMFEALGPNESLRARFARLHRKIRNDFTGLVANGIADGSIHAGIDPEAEAALIVGGLRGVGYQWLLDPERFDPVSALVYLHDTTLERLRAP